MTTLAAALVATAAALGALWTIGHYTRKLARFVVKVSHGLATLAGLPAAVHELAETLRELRDALTNHGDQLADHTTRLDRLERATFPGGNPS